MRNSDFESAPKAYFTIGDMILTIVCCSAFLGLLSILGGKIDEIDTLKAEIAKQQETIEQKDLELRTTHEMINMLRGFGQ